MSEITPPPPAEPGQPRHRFPTKEGFLRRKTGVSIGTVLLVGAVTLGMDVATFGWEWVAVHRAKQQASNTYEPSKIVAGVPGQVERNDGQRLLIEQCPRDTQDTLTGLPTPGSFDQRVGVVAKGCILDWVVDPGDTSSLPGQVVIFGGPADVGKPLIAHT